MELTRVRWKRSLERSAMVCVAIGDKKNARAMAGNALPLGRINAGHDSSTDRLAGNWGVVPSLARLIDVNMLTAAAIRPRGEIITVCEAAR